MTTTNDKNYDYEMTAMFLDPMTQFGTPASCVDRVRSEARPVMLSAATDGNAMALAGIIIASIYCGLLPAARAVAMMDGVKSAHADCVAKARERVIQYLI